MWCNMLSTCSRQTAKLTAGEDVLHITGHSHCALNRNALRLENLGKCYRRYARQFDRVKQWVMGGKHFQEHWALRGVNLTVERGQTVGVLGANGSGKSTLLQLIAGTLTPNEGAIALQGRVAALLELGSGFHPEFTGWENARLQAGILGLATDEVQDRLPGIAEFSELGEALEQPLRTYSSGMIVRLAFSVAISVDPDLLLIDEALAVGDMHFQHKCMGRIRQLREQGVTILLVTHDLGATKRLCDQVHVLEKGRLVQSGPTEPVCNWYFAKMMSGMDNTPKPGAPQAGLLRHGTGQGRIEHCEFLNEQGSPTKQVMIAEQCTLRVGLQYLLEVTHPVLGFYLRDRLGTELVGTNTDAACRPLPQGKSGDRAEVSFRFTLRLRPGTYTLCVALAGSATAPEYVDWIDNALVIEVHDPVPGRVTHGLVAEEIAVDVKATSATSTTVPQAA